jgi:hypothetical protein
VPGLTVGLPGSLNRMPAGPESSSGLWTLIWHQTLTAAPRPIVAIMGTWRVGIFSDDVACDIRDSFRELAGAGISPEDATEQLLRFYADTFAEFSDANIAWIALALTQWNVGRLVTSVKDNAMLALNDHRDLERWPVELRSKRAAALGKARDQLLSPQPPPIRLARPVLDVSPYSPGDLVSYSHPSGRDVAIWVFENKESRHAVGTEVTSSYQVAALGSPALPPLATIQEARPPSFVVGGGEPATLQYWMEYSRDAVGESWNRMGTVPWSQVAVPREYSGILFTRSQRNKRLAAFHIDRLIEDWYEWWHTIRTD